MKEIYFYSEKKINKIIEEMFIGFKIHTTSEEKIFKNDFMNQNILLFVSNEFVKNLSRSFFLTIEL